MSFLESEIMGISISTVIFALIVLFVAIFFITTYAFGGSFNIDKSVSFLQNFFQFFKK